MCRHLAYLGPPVPLARWVLDPPHSLAHQAWAPREMRGTATINADGFGVGWYPDGPTDPARYRQDRPIWADPDLGELAGAVRSGAVLAAVRSASPGMPAGAAACAPFAGGGALFSLNGRVAGWPDSVASLAGSLPVPALLGLPAMVDSTLLFALVQERIRGGAAAAEAVAGVATEVAAAAPGSYLNLLFTDGRTIVATTLGHSLAVRRDGEAVLVSSEPLDDDPRWHRLDDGLLVVATAAGVETTPMSLPQGVLP